MKTIWILSINMPGYPVQTYETKSVYGYLWCSIYIERGRVDQIVVENRRQCCVSGAEEMTLFFIYPLNLHQVNVYIKTVSTLCA